MTKNYFEDRLEVGASRFGICIWKLIHSSNAIYRLPALSNPKYDLYIRTNILQTKTKCLLTEKAEYRWTVFHKYLTGNSVLAMAVKHDLPFDRNGYVKKRRGKKLVHFLNWIKFWCRAYGNRNNWLRNGQRPPVFKAVDFGLMPSLLDKKIISNPASWFCRSRRFSGCDEELRKLGLVGVIKEDVWKTKPIMEFAWECSCLRKRLWIARMRGAWLDWRRKIRLS